MLTDIYPYSGKNYLILGVCLSLLKAEGLCFRTCLSLGLDLGLGLGLDLQGEYEQTSES